MASDDAGASLSVTAPEPVVEWLDRRADELGVTREDLIRELLAAGKALDEDDSTPEPSTAELEADLADARAEFDDKIADVRERVVQVKREADEKAPEGHDHSALAERVDRTASRVDQLAAQVESARSAIGEMESRVDDGFENYEDVLAYLTDATDDVEDKLDTLAEAVVDVRERTHTLAARNASQAAVDDLARTANREGVRSAACEQCGETVHVGLLAAPECPHCASTFSGVDPKQGFFGSDVLRVGEPPELDGETADGSLASPFDGDAFAPSDATTDDAPRDSADLGEDLWDGLGRDSTDGAGGDE